MHPFKCMHVAVCGTIGIKFGTQMQIHLEKVVATNLVHVSAETLLDSEWLSV